MTQLAPPTESLSSRHRVVAAIVLLLLLFSATYANWRHEVLRFSSPVLNALALLAGLALPVIALVLAASRLTGWWRGITSTLLVPLVLCSVIGGLFVAMHLGFVIDGGADRSFEFLGAIRVEGGRVGVYRTNCGATCNYNIVVRHERPVLPGVLLVRRLQVFPAAYRAQFEALGPRTVRVSVPPEGRSSGDSVRSRVYVVQPRVYF